MAVRLFFTFRHVRGTNFGRYFVVMDRSSTLKPAIFFDRDGVINRRLHGDYVKTWDEFQFLGGIFHTLPAVKKAGYLAFVITNQRGIALEVMSERDLLDIHERMQGELLSRTGFSFDNIYYCPHEKDAGCACRKPKPGMLLEAADDYNLDLTNSWMIGDTESDIQAGIAAGCKTIKVTSESKESEANFVVESLEDSIAIIVLKNKLD